MRLATMYVNAIISLNISFTEVYNQFEAVYTRLDIRKQKYLVHLEKYSMTIKN